jgi:hypothetical protein
MSDFFQRVIAQSPAGRHHPFFGPPSTGPATAPPDSALSVSQLSPPQQPPATPPSTSTDGHHNFCFSPTSLSQPVSVALPRYTVATADAAGAAFLGSPAAASAGFPGSGPAAGRVDSALSPEAALQARVIQLELALVASQRRESELAASLAERNAALDHLQGIVNELRLQLVLAPVVGRPLAPPREGSARSTSPASTARRRLSHSLASDAAVGLALDGTSSDLQAEGYRSCCGLAASHEHPTGRSTRAVAALRAIRPATSSSAGGSFATPSASDFHAGSFSGSLQPQATMPPLTSPRPATSPAPLVTSAASRVGGGGVAGSNGGSPAPTPTPPAGRSPAYSWASRSPGRGLPRPLLGRTQAVSSTGAGANAMASSVGPTPPTAQHDRVPAPDTCEADLLALGRSLKRLRVEMENDVDSPVF